MLAYILLRVRKEYNFLAYFLSLTYFCYIKRITVEICEDVKIQNLPSVCAQKWRGGRPLDKRQSLF